jgi:hypothetical protein
VGRYADSLLTEGEVVVLRSRQHVLALVGRAKAAFVMWIVGLLLLGLIVALPNIFPTSNALQTNVVAGLAILLLVLGLVVFLYRFWIWWAQDYIVTNRRLLKVTGVLNKRSGDSSLEKINDAILSQSILGRMLNYGELEILTAAEQANDKYHMLNNPKEFKKVMLTQKHNLETEFMYGRPPTPPLRAESAPAMAAPATAAPATATAAPAAQPAAPPPPPPALDDDIDESHEVTETLARLADLRDKGAITAEEYEQKKDELLGRL